MMGTKDWTDTALVGCLSDNLPLTAEQRSILITLVMERAKQDKDAERYCWLRDDPRGRSLSVAALDWTGEPSAADAAVDAAKSAPPAVGAA